MKKTSAKKPAVKKAPKPKVKDEFTVTHPSGTSKPLNPGKDFAIIVNGISSDASGVIYLYPDRNKTKKIDTFSFKLKKNQTESLFVPGSKKAGWAFVWVHKGSFKVNLDQSPGVKAAVASPKKKPNKSVPSKISKAASARPKPATSSSMIFNGEVPLMAGAKVLKEKTFGANSKIDTHTEMTGMQVKTSSAERESVIATVGTAHTQFLSTVRTTSRLRWKKPDDPLRESGIPDFHPAARRWFYNMV